jgi:hypothetical protein
MMNFYEIKIKKFTLFLIIYGIKVDFIYKKIKG